MRIYLTGFMGSGKTTVGRILAQLMKYDFYDLDQEIEKAAGKHIAEIFHGGGEAAFRRMESDTLQALKTENAVIATGGGCFIENLEWMLANGTVIYLEVPFEQLVRRVGADPSRPLWRNAEALFQQREKSYCKAHVTVDGNHSPEEVAREIARRIEEN